MKTVKYAVLGLLTIGMSLAVHAADSPDKIKVLLITGDDVDVHKWKITSVATAKILEDSGKCEVKISEDLSPLDSADELKKYDVIFFHRFNRGKDPSDTARTRANFGTNLRSMRFS